jgi:predicted permease
MTIMGAIRRFFARLVNTLRPGRAEARAARELEAHVALLEDDYRRRGLAREEAERATRLALGGLEQLRERHRDARAFRGFEDLRRDVAYGARVLRRHPLATATSVLSLAVGIGLNAAIFSVLDWVLIRPLPYPAPHELVRVHTARADSRADRHQLTHEEAAAVSGAEAVRDAAAFTTTTRIMAGPSVQPQHIVVARTKGDLFATLGVAPLVGRAFTRDEMRGGAPVLVLDHDIWQRHFGGDPGVLGRMVVLDGDAHTIVGVMPPARGYPREAQIWRPLTLEEQASDDRELDMVARLRDDVHRERARAEVSALVRSLSNGTRDAWTEDLQETNAAAVAPALEALFVAALLTLLVACGNVAALVAARGADRAGEMAVRGALGATRVRLFAQLMTESVLLAAAGGALGLLLGRWTLDVLVTLAPVSVPRLPEIALDGRVLAHGIAMSLGTGLLVGILPAIRLSRIDHIAGTNRIGWSRGASGQRARRLLVVAQVALAVMLTTAAGLFVRSLQHLVAIDHGFAPGSLVSVRLFPPASFDGDAQRLFLQLAEESLALRGVEAAAVAMRLPTQVGGVSVTIRPLGAGNTTARAVVRPVSASYFDVVGIPIRAGRGFAVTDARGTARVAVVNATFVRELLGAQSPIGTALVTSLASEPLTIVGVAGDVTPSGQTERAALYVPLLQSPIGEGHLVVRAADPDGLIPVLRSRLGAVTPVLAFDRVARVAETLEAGRAIDRFITVVTATFAALALLLSSIGVYGLTAGDVSARWRELAIRLALGSSRGEALSSVLRPCLAVLGIGGVVGVLGALGLGPSLASLLHGVSPVDVSALALAPALLVAVGLGAALAAARRVLRTDPAATLRCD